MGKKCIIPGCTSGYSSNKERVSLFRIPKDDKVRAKWVRAIPATRVPLTSSHSICEKHFLDSDIERNFIHKDANGKIIANVPFKHPRLTKSAVPSIFASTHEYVKKDMRSGVQSTSNIAADRILAVTIGMTESSFEDSLPSTANENLLLFGEQSDIDENLVSAPDLISHNVHISWIDHMLPEDNVCPTVDYTLPEENASRVQNRVERLSGSENIFTDIYEHANAVSIPLGWYRYTSSSGNKCVGFSNFETKMEPNSVQVLPRKSVFVSEDGNVYTSVSGKTVPTRNVCRSLERIHNVEELSRLLSTFASVGLCSGVQLLDDSLAQCRILHQDPFGQWRHKNCSVLSNSRICTACQRLKKSIAQRKRRLVKQSRMRRINLPYKNLDENSKIIAMRKRLRSQNAAVRRARERVKKRKDTVIHIND